MYERKISRLQRLPKQDLIWGATDDCPCSSIHLCNTMHRNRHTLLPVSWLSKISCWTFAFIGSTTVKCHHWLRNQNQHVTMCAGTDHGWRQALLTKQAKQTDSSWAAEEHTDVFCQCQEAHVQYRHTTADLLGLNLLGANSSVWSAHLGSSNRTFHISRFIFQPYKQIHWIGSIHATTRAVSCTHPTQCVRQEDCL